jgi:hypothetical protein
MREPPRPTWAQAFLHWIEMTGTGVRHLPEAERSCELLQRLYSYSELKGNREYEELVASLEAKAKVSS